MHEHDEDHGTAPLSPSLSVQNHPAGTLRNVLRYLFIILITLPHPNLNRNPQPQPHQPPSQKTSDLVDIQQTVIRNLPIPPGAQFAGTTQIDMRGAPTEVAWFLLGQEWYLQAMGKRWRITGVRNNNGVDLLALQKTILEASATTVDYSIEETTVAMRSSSRTFGIETINNFEIERRVVQCAVTQLAGGDRTIVITVRDYSVVTMGTPLLSGKNTSATISAEPAIDLSLAVAVQP